ncbi:MAG: Ig-like domain-containing protein [Candidatus Jorgensenbacteria bacterium]|nr:Ig-like domain-containing protein [Candidatus Jorgensenbacteria bacterium]
MRNTVWFSKFLLSSVLFLIGCLDTSRSSNTVINNNNGTDTTRPTVVSVLPVSGATSVAVSTSVSATFSEPVTPATTNASSYKVYAGTTEVSGTVSLDSTNKILTFAPVTTLAYATVFL